NPDSDRQLARSLCRAGNVLLPLLRESVPRYGEPPREIPPTAPLAGCAAGIGECLPGEQRARLAERSFAQVDAAHRAVAVRFDVDMPDAGA
ncbi:hypothetical protein, partial [Stenotrophomonas maltophilia]|uniref:hypothetical protein n=1 Tax=Stenotrophomonas maltophilia TaxID=40324 RepID=UPI0013DB8E8D